MTEQQALYSTEHIEKSTFRENGQARGVSKGLVVSSAFQPIFSLAHKRIVGYEALARAAEPDTGRSVSPEKLFGPEQTLPDIVFMDRLCRYIHVENFQAFGDPLNWLFLNLAPQTIVHGKEFGSFFRELLAKFNLPPHQVVIEIVEHPISSQDNEHLIDTVKFYQDLGCLTAIDDFGAGHSNFDRIWALKPNIVKLDRSMLLHAASRTDIRQLLPGIVALLHQGGAIVVMEGIEDESQAIIAMESDADLVQGYYFSKPNMDLASSATASPPFDALFDRYKTSEALRGQESQYLYQRYHTPYATAVDMIKSGNSLMVACNGLFEDDGVIRCYLLQSDGQQIGDTVTSHTYAGKTDPRFKPLEDAKSADWFRRHYLRRAIVHPEQLQVTRPYLSITGAHMCTTLSMMFTTASGNVLLCCDVLL